MHLLKDQINSHLNLRCVLISSSDSQFKNIFENKSIERVNKYTFLGITTIKKL